MTSPEKIKKCLAKYRAGPVVGLGQEHPVGYQMDVDFCASLTEDLGLLGSQWETRKATPTLWQQIPSKCGVYLFLFESTLKLSTANNGEFKPRLVLYVGRAGDATSRKTLRDRYRNEYSKYVGGDPEVLWGDAPELKRSERLAKYLTIYPLQYWYCIVEDNTKIVKLEDSLIKLLNPPLNKAGRTKLKLAPPIPAFRSP